MTNNRLIIAACIVAALAGAGAVWSGGRQDAAIQDASATAASVIRTDLPVTPATGEPELASLTTASPAAGTVTRVVGPFDDRFHLEDLAFDGVAVTGRLTVTSDVSDLLELQVLAGFYDRGGELLGSGRFTYHLVEEVHEDPGPPSETKSFRVPVPKRFRGAATAAAVGVPVLVNE